MRFSTSILFSLSLGLEMLTPYFPSYFLILATVANIGRSIALAAYLATSVITSTPTLCHSRLVYSWQNNTESLHVNGCLLKIVIAYV